MFDHEIIIDEQDLKLRIQSEIMRSFDKIKASADIGYTSWEVAETVVHCIKSDKSYKQKSIKNLDILDAKL